MKILTTPLASTVGQLAEWRAQAYQAGFLKRSRLKVPVISVGNLTFGGTGKTPVSHFLIEMLIAKGHRPGLVSKAYKAKSKKIQKINSATDSAEIVGDEALLLAKKFSNIPVYSGPRKAETAQELVRNENVDLVIVDDGFQHLALHRDLDILLMDASENPGNYYCFPKGRAREKLEAIERAHLYFLTKCNLANNENLQYHRDILRNKDVFEFDYRVKALQNLRQDRQESPEYFRGKDLVLVSGLAQPQSFLQLMKSLFPDQDIRSREWPDHHHYTVDDMRILEKEVTALHTVLLTTEKDAVKLSRVKAAYELPFWQVQLELAPRFQVESLYAKILSFLS